MYSIKCDGEYLHKPDANIFVINAKCTMEVNKTGSLNFYIQQDHQNIDCIKLLKSEIIVYRDAVPIWYGRPLNKSFDIDGLMYLECEGELAYLLDSNMRRSHWQTEDRHIGDVDIAIRDLWHRMVTMNANANRDDYKKFNLLENVTVKDSNGYVTSQANYESILDYINDKVIPRFGGYFKVRRDEGKRALDYLAEFPINENQTIEFGKNIVNLEKSIKGDCIYTALIPLGAKIDEITDIRLTINSLPDSTEGNIVKNADYIYDTEAVEKYGWIFSVERWDDVTIAENLLKKAKEKLRENCKERLYLRITAVDLHDVDVNIDALEVGTKIRCKSEYHDFDEYMIIKSIEIDLDDPSNSSVELVQGIDKGEYSESPLTEQRNSDSSTLAESNIDDMATSSDISSLKSWCNNTFVPIATGSGGTPVDLSTYAKISDVNTAFNQLANALQGV